MVQQGELEDGDDLENSKTGSIIQDDEMKTHSALAKCLYRLCHVLTFSHKTSHSCSQGLSVPRRTLFLVFMEIRIGQDSFHLPLM